jgi:hypothetical protein
MSDPASLSDFDGVVDLDGGCVFTDARQPAIDLTPDGEQLSAPLVTSGAQGLVVTGPVGWPGRVELSVMTRAGVPPAEQALHRQEGWSPSTQDVVESTGRVQVRTLSGDVVAEVATTSGRVEVVAGLRDREPWDAKGVEGVLWVQVWSLEERDQVRFGTAHPAVGDDLEEDDDDEYTEEELAEIARFAEEAHARMQADQAARLPAEPDPEPPFEAMGLDAAQAARAADVLAQLDDVAARAQFADLGHPYSYAVDARLHAYADAGRWALVVETVGYDPRGSNLYDVIHVYGDCLTDGVPGCREEDFRARVENMDEVEDRDEPEAFAGSAAVRVRGQDLPVDAGPVDDLVDVFRSLVPAHRDLLLADEAELGARIPADLPKVLLLEEWHQPDLLETAPSRSEAYRLLAAVLARGDPAYYRPSEEPNTHWENWPESGSL